MQTEDFFALLLVEWNDLWNWWNSSGARLAVFRGKTHSIPERWWPNSWLAYKLPWKQGHLQKGECWVFNIAVIFVISQVIDLEDQKGPLVHLIRALIFSSCVSYWTMNLCLSEVYPPEKHLVLIQREKVDLVLKKLCLVVGFSLASGSHEEFLPQIRYPLV